MNANNGMITKIWGPPLWTALHCISFGYPENPTPEHKKEYKKFFQTLGKVLPCKYCRDSYQIFITEEDSILDNRALENRKTLTKWLFNLHNKVNKKLGVDYGVTMKDVDKKYESYRAKCSTKNTKGCIVPAYHKKLCYQEANKKDCPIIDYESGKLFYQYAKIREIKEKNFYFWNILDKRRGKIIKDKIWDQRNKYCNKIINYMRENGISPLEKKGRWRGLPNKLELRLLLCLSTSLSSQELEPIKQKLHYLFLDK